MQQLSIRTSRFGVISFAVLAALIILNGTQSAHAQTRPEFVGSETCSNCHEATSEEWQGSHHALAWTLPSAETILGDFSDVTFTHQGVTTRFYQDNGIYMIGTEGPDGNMTQYPVAGVVGVTPLQQYLIETKPGTLQSFDLAWDTDLQQWYHLYPTQDLPAGDGLHWTGPYKNWNARCAECHSTDFEKDYSPLEKTYSSTQAEIGVGCESCHGPAEAHMEWAQHDDSFDPAEWVGVTPEGFTIDLSSGGETVVQQCAGCHARREPFGDGNPLPGTPFHDAYRLSTLSPGLYHPDGQILDEVYVYGSFLQSKMNEKGVTCTNCHNPHTAELKAEGNAICTQCHSEAGNPEFSSLPLKTYDAQTHSFHPEGSEGAECKSCHMIERTYMGVDGRRDHSFRIPRPDLSVKLDTPNACNDCHDDKSPDWAADILEGWYPESKNRGRHYGQTFAAARNDPSAEVLNLIEIAEHRTLPAIVRATALEQLTNVANEDIARRLEPLLEDEDPLVRVSAIAVQRGAVETDRSVRLVGLLADPVKAVRIAAARNFLGMRIAHMPEKMNQNLSTAMGEWQSSLAVKTDFPETHLVLGGLGLTTRNIEAALNAFEDAVELDPQLAQAWSMIIRIHAATENFPAAKDAADRAVAKVPNDPNLLQMQKELSEDQ